VRAISWFFVVMGPLIVIVALALLFGFGSTSTQTYNNAVSLLGLGLIVSGLGLFGILIVAVRRPSRRRRRQVRRYGGDWDEFDEWDSRRKDNA
jgi:hypothetical protein